MVLAIENANLNFSKELQNVLKAKLKVGGVVKQ